MELQIRNLSKRYPNGVHALKDVTLAIPRGMFGLLGPNGAGKSTLMRTIATLQEPDAGSIRLGDIDVLREKDEVRKTLGYLPQEFGVYPKVSAERLLEHFAVLKGITGRRARREIVDALQGRIWRRVVARSELARTEEEHAVVSTRLLAGRTVVHVYGETSPGAGFEPVEADLEDVYFSTMAGHDRRPSEVAEVAR